MGLHRDLLPDELFPAEHHRASPVVGEEAVVVAAALTKALAQVIAGGAGEDGEVDVIHGYKGCVCGRFQKTVTTFLKLGKVRDLPGFHNAFLRAKGDK